MIISDLHLKLSILSLADVFRKELTQEGVIITAGFKKR
jgi:hypothetical protein